MDKERDCKECIVSTAKVGQASFSKLTADTAVNQVFTKPTLNGVAACHVAHEANKFQDKHAFCVSMSVQLQYSQKQLTVFFFFFFVLERLILTLCRRSARSKCTPLTPRCGCMLGNPAQAKRRADQERIS